LRRPRQFERDVLGLHRAALESVVVRNVVHPEDSPCFARWRFDLLFLRSIDASRSAASVVPSSRGATLAENLGPALAFLAFWPGASWEPQTWEPRFAPAPRRFTPLVAEPLPDVRIVNSEVGLRPPVVPLPLMDLGGERVLGEQIGLFENRRGHIIDRQDEIVPSKILLAGKKPLQLAAAGLAREEQRRDDRDEDQGIGDDLIEQLLILLAKTGSVDIVKNAEACASGYDPDTQLPDLRREVTEPP